MPGISFFGVSSSTDYYMKKIRTKDFSRICFYLRPWYIDGLKSKAGKTIMIAVDFGIHDTIDDGKVKATMIKILDLILQTTVKSDKVCDVLI